MEFNDLEWHDAIIRNIVIDRTNPGKSDTIEITITWPSNKTSKIIFRDVYYANLSLGFGVIGDEVILDANIINHDDVELANVKNTWHSYYQEIENIIGFRILTVSTASNIAIYAFSYHIEVA